MHGRDAGFSWEQIVCGWALASGTLRVKGPKHLLNLYEEYHPLLRGQPNDVLTLLRPAGNADPRDSFIRIEGVPDLHSEVRAAKFFNVTCEGCRRFGYRKQTTFTDEEELVYGKGKYKALKQKQKALKRDAEEEKAKLRLGGNRGRQSEGHKLLADPDEVAWRFDSIPSSIVNGIASIKPPTGELPDYSFDLKVMYCMRHHTIHKVGPN